MSIQKIIAEMREKGKNLKKEEQQILQEIANLTAPEFAEQASNELDPKKHVYDFEQYISMLRTLKNLLAAGVQNCKAIEAVQCGLTEEDFF